MESAFSDRPIVKRSSGVYKGRHYKGDEELDALADKVIALLRPEGLLVWQEKEVLKKALQLVDWETLK